MIRHHAAHDWIKTSRTDYRTVIRGRYFGSYLESSMTQEIRLPLLHPTYSSRHTLQPFSSIANEAFHLPCLWFRYSATMGLVIQQDRLLAQITPPNITVQGSVRKSRSRRLSVDRERAHVYHDVYTLPY